MIYKKCYILKSISWFGKIEFFVVWTNAAILLIGTLETNFSEILIEIYTFSFHLKMLPRKWRPFDLDPNMLKQFCCFKHYYIIF